MEAVVSEGRSSLPQLISESTSYQKLLDLFKTMEPVSTPPDWTVQTGSSMMSIGTHSLSVSISGPPCNHRRPLAVILAGAGDVASSYVVVERLISPFIRVFLYDRSGLGCSQLGPNRPTATTAAVELHSLLQTAKISRHLLLVSHSYGAIIAREYLHLYPDEVSGMVLAEGSGERQSDFFKIPDPNINAVMGDLNFAQVTGLRADAKLSREEWRARAIEIYKGGAAGEAEAAAFVEVCETLRVKEQYKKRAMGDKPLSVIRCNSMRDYERIYEKGVEVGNGTEEQRKAFRELLDRWDGFDRDIKEEQLKLSSNSRLIHVSDCGHNVHLTRPDVVSEEIKWVRDRIVDNLSHASSYTL